MASPWLEAMLSELEQDQDAAARLRDILGPVTQPDELVTAQEFAQIRKVTTRTVNRWAAEGRVEATKAGRGWRLKADAEVKPATARQLPPYKPARNRPRRTAHDDVADAIRGKG